MGIPDYVFDLFELDLVANNISDRNLPEYIICEAEYHTRRYRDDFALVSHEYIEAYGIYRVSVYVKG